MDYGLFAIVPPIVAIALAVITRQVILSLFIGILLGATAINGWNPIIGLIASIRDIIGPQIADSWNASIVVYLVVLGGFIGILEKGGGTVAFVEWMKKYVTNRVRAQLAVWISGIVIWFSDTPNTLILGPVFRPITDKFKVSREKLSYIVDSTSAPLPVLFPITGWGAFILGLIKTELENTGITDNPLITYVKSVPFVLYSFSAVLLVFLVAYFGLEFGPMKRAELRAIKEGKVLRDGAKPLRKDVEVTLKEGSIPTPAGMLVPMVVLLATLLAMFAYTGGYPKVSFWQIFGNADSMTSLNVSFFVATIVAGFYAVRSKVLTFKEVLDVWTEGVRTIIDGMIILVLAWSIGAICKEIGTGPYVVKFTKGILSPTLVYVVIFIAGALTGFGTGTSWGTFALFMPIAIPLAHAMGISIYPAIGAVLAGGVFGDHCSPISDTTVLSSIGTSSDHVDHVTTQIPYAVTAAIASCIGFIMAGFTGSAIISLLSTIGSLVLLSVVIKSFGAGFDYNRTKEI